MKASELASFVPTWLTEQLDPVGGGISSVRFSGAVVFADISGFSVLAAALVDRYGTAGAERLSLALDGLFGALLREARAHGGEIASFAGDGLLACYPAADDAPRDATLEAARAALAMNAAVARIGQVDGVDVGLHAGVVAGELCGLAAGGHRGAWRTVVLGQPIQELRTLFPGTSRGQTVLSKRALEQIAGDVAVDKVDEERSLLLRIAGKRRMRDDPRSATPAARAVEPWIPDAIRVRAEIPLGDWLAEIRTLTVLFISVPDADADTDALSLAVRAVQEELDAHGGTLHQVAVDEKGVTITCAFGLPAGAGERAPASASRCALALRERFASLRIRAGLGLSTGRLFVGTVGDAFRREVAIVGQSMIDAARIAAASAHGAAAGSSEIAADSATRQGADDEVEFRAAPPVRVRGRSLGAIATWRPLVARRAVLARGAFDVVGRTEATKAIESALGTTPAGIVVFTGPPGIGKSRLLALAAERGRSIGATVVTVLGDRASIDRPYHAWREALELASSIGEGSTVESRRAAATAALSNRPDCEGLAALLGPALGVAFEETAETSALAPQARAEATASLITRLVTTTERSLVLVDDAQWLDAASAQVLVTLRRDRPASFVIGLRDEGPSLAEPLAALMGAPEAVRIALEPLDEAAIERIVAARIGIGGSNELTRWVAGRAAGNPFFAGELTASVISSGLFDAHAIARGPRAEELEKLATPGRVELVVARRIDGLPVAAQLGIKAASVLGMRFHEDALRALHPLDLDSATSGIRALEEAGLCRRTHGPIWEIAHRIVLDVAYGLLPTELRSRLHQAAAAWSELHAPEASELAYHWERAGDRDRAMHWLEAAWREADRAGALADSHAIARRAAALDPREPRARARWSRRMADASANMSAYTRAIEEARAALLALDQPMPNETSRWRARLARGIGEQLVHAVAPQRLWPESKPGDDEVALSLTRAAEGFFFVHGDRLVAITCFLDSMNAAERAGIVGQVPNAYGIVGLALTAVGLHRVGRGYLDRGLAESTAAGDERHIASSLFHLASFEAMRGHWSEAARLHAACVERCERSGSRYLLVFVRSAQAMNALISGDLHLAESVATDLLALSNELRQLRGVAIARASLAAAALSRGETERALELSQASRDALRAEGDLSWGMPAGTLARALLRIGRREEAVREADDIIAALVRVRPADYRRLDVFAGAAETLVRVPGHPRERVDIALSLLARFARGQPVGRARLKLLEGRVLGARGDRNGAERALEQAITQARKGGLRVDRARAELALAELRSDRALAHEAREALRDSGVTDIDA